MIFSTAPGQVKVRMYNVGFGDAFLIAFPGEERSVRVLIDCGVHGMSPRPRPMAEVVGHIIQSVTDEDGVPRIDLVIGTHRHQDHVSGFEDERWASVEVREVWMPWTEHPTDAPARAIREAQSTAARRLHVALQQLNADEGLVSVAENALKNARAMATLHDGFAGSPVRRFLAANEPEKLEPTSLPTSLPAVVVHLLGPTRDPEIIRDMEPPSGEGYFRFSNGQVDTEARPAFAEEWALDPAALVEESHSQVALAQKDLDRLAELERDTHFGLVVALESAVNGTSLMLAFEIGDAVLLFPGDAQWGSWRRLLDDEKARSLLARTTFYKVGHHGSHNATPKDFVEDIFAERLLAAGQPLMSLRAMVSTHPIKMWEYIPKQELLDALVSLTPQVARSDGSTSPVRGFSYSEDLYVETDVPV